MQTNNASFTTDSTTADLVGARTIDVRTHDVISVYRELTLAEEDGLVLDVRSAFSLSKFRFVVTLAGTPSALDEQRFVRLARRLRVAGLAEVA